MFNSENDRVESITFSNNFEKEYNDIYLSSFTFLPFYEIRGQIDSEKFDILDDDMLLDSD